MKWPQTARNWKKCPLVTPTQDMPGTETFYKVKFGWAIGGLLAPKLCFWSLPFFIVLYSNPFFIKRCEHLWLEKAELYLRNIWIKAWHTAAFIRTLIFTCEFQELRVSTVPSIAYSSINNPFSFKRSKHFELEKAELHLWNVQKWKKLDILQHLFRFWISHVNFKN